MHCKPKQRPSVGILFSRAYFKAPSFPSIPRTPKPPGTQIASTSPKFAAASLSVAQLSLGTHLIFTLAKLAKPPALSASVTERYASGRSIYFPTNATVTSTLGL